MARVRANSLETCTELQGWEMAEVTAGAASSPAELARLPLRWQSAQVPGSVASALRAAKAFEASQASKIDQSDWWFRCRVEECDGLRFEGLATLCSVFLDGEPLFTSDNMFVEHELELAAKVTGELLLRFRSVATALKQRRPPPRWKARLYDSQNLRFLRTTVLGRIPTWGVSAPVIGPWRPVLQVARRGARVQQAAVRATALPHGGGRVDVTLRIRGPVPRKATIKVGSGTATLSISRPTASTEECELSGSVTLPDVARWWPHTHGAQPLYPVAIELDSQVLDLGRTGFRELELDREGGKFELSVNGARLFCRGACWTTTDVLTLAGDPELLLRSARAAGMNLIRVTGFGVYEADRFYDLCDELGILVWQDFMFASLDYPSDDEAFVASVRTEASQQLARLQLAPSLAVLCGSSEARQAAAMNGLDAGMGGAGIFGELLPALSREARPDVPYVDCSSSASPVGTRADDGPAHYFAVGGYLRPPTEIRRNGLRFASECLAFGHVPADRTLEAFMPARAGIVQHPAWKQGMPRDAGTGWDFDDVREHYLRELFGVEPVRLRSQDPGRYLEASRVVTGEITAQAIAEMRAQGSTCAGALILSLSDLLPGAGWGLVDATGRRKPVWSFVRRAFTSRLQLTDEGLNGLRLHAINESATPLLARLRVRFFRDGEVLVASGERELIVPPRETVAVDVEQLLGRFFDSAYAYRFGPPGFDFACAELSEGGVQIGEASFFPGKLPLDHGADVGLNAKLELAGPGSALLSLSADRLAHWVALDAGSWLAEDDYFHLIPGTPRTIRLSALAGSPLPEVTLLPFNSRRTVRARAAQGRADD